MLDKYNKITGQRVYELLNEKGYEDMRERLLCFGTSLKASARRVQKCPLGWWKRTREKEKKHCPGLLK
jgi:hypothetical protein